MEESVKNLEQEQPCGEMENAMEQEQQAPIDFLVHCKQALRLEKIDIANYSVTMAKHATMIDYRMATGFEALMGYLYLTEQFDRLVELAGYGLEKIGEFETE